MKKFVHVFLSMLLSLPVAMPVQAAGPACFDLFRAGPVAAPLAPAAAVSERIARSVFDDAANERVTVQVMDLVRRQKRLGTDSVEGWLGTIHETQAQHPLNAMEHTALLYIHSSAIFAEHPNRELQPQLEAMLAQSHEHLVGRTTAKDAWKSGLPKSTLSRVGETARLFHDAVLKETKLDDQKKASGWRARITKDNCITAATTLVTVTGLFFESTRPFAALVLGMAQASLNEHLIHIGIGHATQKMAKAFRRAGKVGIFAEQVTLAHRLHHSVVSENFGAVILEPHQVERAEKILRSLSESLVLDRMRDTRPHLTDAEIKASPEYAADVEHLIIATRRGNYGINGTPLGAASMLVSNAPWYLMNFAIYGATGSEVFLVAANASLVGWTLQSLYSHRYLHIRPGDENKVQTNWLQNAYMKSFAGRIQQRLHFVHHESPHPIGSTKNGAIMAASISDRLMGGVTDSTLQNLIKYHQQGFLPRSAFSDAAQP